MRMPKYFWTASLRAILGYSAIMLSANVATSESTPFSDEIANRALAGAEWIAAEAKTLSADPFRRTEAATDLVEWLILVLQHPDFDAGGMHSALVQAGFADTVIADSIWKSEFARVFAAHRDIAKWQEPRRKHQIEADLVSLPTVALEPRDTDLRNQLLAERRASLVSASQRRILDRIGDRLRALALKGGQP